MKIEVTDGIVRHGGKRYGVRDVFDVNEEDGERLISIGVAVPVKGSPNTGPVEYNGEKLFEDTEDLKALKVDELKAICKYLEIPAKGNKDDLVAAIEAESEIEK
ncbi:SAP domain-containing protein [Sulfurovum sp.]|uniref:SAP domain-containing protein n=1 Tax=Sulfurovum sp. TaxID=1969726 RepID=UPI0026202B6B|nr:SAP domain-containing protein [Sulfurovum sp.]